TFTANVDTNNTSASANVRIPLAGTGTVADVRDAILRVLSPSLFTDSPVNAIDYGAELGLAPVAIGNDSIQLGTLPAQLSQTVPPTPLSPGHTVDLSGIGSGLQTIGTVDSVVDGDQFTFTRGDSVVTFEFDSNDSIAPAIEGDSFRRITFSRTDTPDQIATSIAEALRDSSIDLSEARTIGNGLVSIGGLPG
ncbi:unnamed protein product, partial [Hapterophycus canaliculatus]